FTLVTLASLHTVGVILFVAMLITPTSTAYLLTYRLSIMIFLASFFVALSSVVGLYISFIYNLSSGTVISLEAPALFVFTFLFAPKQGIVWRYFKTNKQCVSESYVI